MILKSLFTELFLEIVLCLISAYIVYKSARTKGSSPTAHTYFNFSAANLLFVVSYLLSCLHKLNICFAGVTAGYILYLILLFSLAVASCSWFVYVETVIEKNWASGKKGIIISYIPVLVFLVLSLVSVKTGWIFTIDKNGAYSAGSLEFIQYVVCFGYCVMSMFDSAKNYFTVKEKSNTDKVLFLTMIVDLVAVVIQILIRVNMMPTALTMTVLLSYINVFSAELKQAEIKVEAVAAAQQLQSERYEAITQNSKRLFALEDTFESLYDVNLETGTYTSFAKGDFYKRNISDKLVSQTEFFESLRANVERVVLAEDREAVYNVQTRESIISGLEKNDHIDHYYRIITDKGPMWLKMRIVYKDAEKKNVVLGIFNAEKEMAEKKKDELFRQELLQTNARLFALEDTFEALYDVDLDSGIYESFVKGEFYKDKVAEKLVEPKSYFKELRENIDSVIYPEDRDELYKVLSKDSMRKRLDESGYFDHYYRISTMLGFIWFKTRVVYKDDSKKNVIIGVFNAAKEMAAKEREEKRIDETLLKLRHEQLREQLLSKMLEYDDDPIEILKGYAEQVRALIDCDQVIYRDLEETRIMVNSEGIADTWAVPIEYCRQCEHFNAHHPMYKDGYTEMENCQKGWQGIPVYEKCPIKSSLTRIVYCDKEAAGYLAIHYVQKYHTFTDAERETIEVFAHILSIAISRYNAKKQVDELGGVKKTLNMMFSLSTEFDPIIVIEPDSGEYKWFQSRAQEIEDLTSMTIHGENIYKDVITDANTIIHPDDRQQYTAFYTRENLMHIAETGEIRETENRWKVGPDGTYLWKYNKAVRMLDDSGRVFVVVGVIDTTETKEKENQVQRAYSIIEETNRRNKLIHEAVKAGVWCYGINEQGEVVSADYDSFTGGKVAEKAISAPMSWVEALHPDDKERVYAEFMAAINDRSGNTPYETTYRLMGSKHEYMWIKSSGRLAARDDGTYELFGISIDITEQINEQKRHLIETEESKKLIDSIAASYNAAFAVNMKTNDFRLLRMDNNILGIDREYKDFEDAKAFFFSILPESDRETMRHELDYNVIREKLRNVKSYNIEYRVPIKNAMVWHIMNVTLIDNDYVAIGFAVRDLSITQKHLEDKRYNEYFALYEIDIDTGMMKIVKDSPYYGIARVGKALPFADEMIQFASGLDDEPRKFFEQFTDLEFVKKRFATEDKLTYAYRSNNVGEKNWVDCTCYVTLRHKDGTPAMFTFGFSLVDSLGVHRHELQQKYVEQNAVLVSQQEELEIARDAAESANKSKTDFLFSMSHDIRTPMNAIMGFTNMAIKHIDEKEKAIDCLEKTQKAGAMLLSLINSVLEVSRIESGNATLEEQPGNVYYSFANIENTLSELAASKDIDLSFEFGEIRNKYVYADFSRCMRIFVNIISNAIKYTPEGGFVKVKCEQTGEVKDGTATFLYTVSDNGIGMSEEFQKHIFEQFARENTSTVSGIQGSGLGMSVVKSFVELMGGKISLESKQGEGSTFYIALPFRLQEKEEYTDPLTGEVISAGEKSEIAEEIDFTGKKVLLVEDNELNREIAIEILEEEGFAVDDAEDGNVAVDILREKGPDFYDFILMDIQMPTMNGYDATKAIRAMYPDAKLPIIALSANAFAEDKKKSIEAGMDNHVAKPINIKELFGVLAKYF